jgi:predicted restriction endonuclease
MKVFYVIVDPRDFSELSQLNETYEWKLDLKYKKIFDKIEYDDLIMFCKKSFHSCDIILKLKEKKIFDNDAEDLQFRVKNKTLFLKFRNKDFLSTYSNSFNVKNLSKSIPGIYYLKNSKVEIKEKKLKEKKLKEKKLKEKKLKEKKLKEKKLKEKKLKEKKHGIPEKIFSIAKRTKRDRKKVANLKLEYLDKCQICNYHLVLENNKRHSEVHHLRPIGNEGGNDDTDNMIVLCPNHHKAFDFSVLRLDLSGNTVIDLNGNSLKNSRGKIQKVKFKTNHKLSKVNLTYQYYRRTS